MKWKIDPPHASVSVSARHMMVSTVRAKFAGVTGEVELDPAKPESARVSLSIPAASVDTGDPKRDGHLRSPDFLDAERHPAVTFRSTKVRKAGDGYVVTGDLEIRGTSRPVDVNVELNGIVEGQNGRIAGFAATATIDRTQWGLVWNMPVPGGLLVSEKLKVEFDLEAIESKVGEPAAAA